MHVPYNFLLSFVESVCPFFTKLSYPSTKKKVLISYVFAKLGFTTSPLETKGIVMYTSPLPST